jgi:hypothetical protein
MLRRNTFGYGVAVASSAGTILLAFLYVVAAPTDEFRARIPFLLNSGGVGPVLFIFCCFEGVGLVTVVSTGFLSLRSSQGASLAAVIMTGLVYSDLLSHVVPQFQASAKRWAVFGAVAIISVAVLLFERAAFQRSERGEEHKVSRV